MGITSILEWREKIAQVPFREVSLGYRTVILFNENQFEEGQIGYSRDTQGKDLTGTGGGDWKSTWLVIACEDELDDPIFVDTSKPEWPVMTAMHGEESWEPQLIALSFNGFISALSEIRAISQGRNSPVELECNPIPPNTVNQILDRIARLTGVDDLEFWESWMRTE